MINEFDGIIEDFRFEFVKRESIDESPIKFAPTIDGGTIDLAKYLPTAGEWYAISIIGGKDDAGGLLIDEVHVTRIDKDQGRGEPPMAPDNEVLKIASDTQK